MNTISQADEIFEDNKQKINSQELQIKHIEDLTISIDGLTAQNSEMEVKCQLHEFSTLETYFRILGKAQHIAKRRHESQRRTRFEAG